jgi:glycosyltransferase involved in cell wall biosynthesis
MRQYVCAFRGRRDNYQVPVALAECGLLNSLITDIYATETLDKITRFLPKTLAAKIAFRSIAELSPTQVSCLWKTAFLEQIRHNLGLSKAKTFALLDQNFSRAAAVRARKAGSNLLLYTPYAWEAFRETYTHNPRKVLFQYHPHGAVERRILAEDVRRFPCVQHSYAEETGSHLSAQLQSRVDDCWRYADLVLCASGFTRDSLVEAGADSKVCAIIPYGVDIPELPKTQLEGNFHALFVGSGIQRKGLHHLLYAWQQACLPEGSQLTLVCRNLDPGIEQLISKTKQIRLLRGVDAITLGQLYTTNMLFVMPSLVEGFGQVYLEALSHGCPVLGTPHTCLPDLGTQAEGVFLTPAGDVDQLAAHLEHLANILPTQPELRDKARACATRFSWQQFRSSLVNLL